MAIVCASPASMAAPTPPSTHFQPAELALYDEPKWPTPVAMPPINSPATAAAMLAYFNTGAGKSVRDELEKLKDLDKAMEEKLVAAIKAFKAGWKPVK